MAFLITTVEFSYFVDISCLPSSIFFTLSVGLFSKVQINYISPLLKKQNVSSKAVRLIDCILFYPHFSPTICWCHAVSYFQDVPTGIIYLFCHLLPLPTPPQPSLSQESLSSFKTQLTLVSMTSTPLKALS